MHGWIAVTTAGKKDARRGADLLIGWYRWQSPELTATRLEVSLNKKQIWRLILSPLVTIYCIIHSLGTTITSFYRGDAKSVSTLTQAGLANGSDQCKSRNPVS